MIWQFVLDEFSAEMQKEVLCSVDGRYYRDFYKIIKQSEKQQDLQNIILEMKKSFHGYPLNVDCQQPFTDEKQNNTTNVNPKGLGTNSRAEQGNLLEAINLSLNGMLHVVVVTSVIGSWPFRFSFRKDSTVGWLSDGGLPMKLC